jgi:hypothetical protein
VAILSGDTRAAGSRSKLGDWVDSRLSGCSGRWPVALGGDDEAYAYRWSSMGDVRSTRGLAGDLMRGTGE